jgi:tRNA threonylcarbamoyladenosine biosynthesis protein TsaB
LDFAVPPPKLPGAMARLAQLLANHRRILVLDAVSTQVAVGLLRADESAIWAQSSDDASRGIFRGTETVLSQAAVSLADIDAFLFCAGPGSMLGTRTVAMTLRTWLTLKVRPAYSYQSLAAAARAEWIRRPRAFTVIADARRETWHTQAIATDGSLSPLQRAAAAGLPAGELLTPAHFRAWSTPPPGIGECPYDLAAIFARLGDSDIFHADTAPDAFQHESPEYKKWSAQTHSAETAPKR